MDRGPASWRSRVGDEYRCYRKKLSVYPGPSGQAEDGNEAVKNGVI